MDEVDEVSEEIENDIINFLENKTIKNFKEFINKYNLDWVDAIDIFTFRIIGREVEVDIKINFRTLVNFKFERVTKWDEVNEIKKQRRKIMKEVTKNV